MGNRLSKIYTRTGDDGKTALGNGERVAKYSGRVAAYGTVDELNSFVGVARTEAEGEVEAALSRIQNDLFDLGADLCTPDTGEKLEYEPLRMVAAQVTRLENEIDQLNADLEPLNSFVLPGGTPASAYLHQARTVARRAERLMVRLRETEKVSDPAIQYINRLSDFLFVAARWANEKGAADIKWTPGANRTTWIEFTEPVTVEGAELEAGRYGLWTVPHEDEAWEVAFVREWDTHHSYFPRETEAARIRVDVEEGDHMEVLAFYFPVVGPYETTLRFHWGNTILPLRITVPQ